MSEFMDKAAITGVGTTEFSKNSGRSELQLSCEASLAAIKDAGLVPADIDGIVKYDMDSTEEVALQRNLGIPDLNFYAQQGYGGNGSCAVIQTAAMAVACGMAKHVLVFRGLNERSGTRFGTDVVGAGGGGTYATNLDYYMPYGLFVPAMFCSFQVNRYFHEFGVDREKLGWVAITQRKHAMKNPTARFTEELTWDDYLNSRWIVRPTFRLFDCCVETDGAAAVVISRADLAKDLPNTPALIHGAAIATGPENEFSTSYYREKIWDSCEQRLMAEKIHNQTGLTAKDYDVAELYDAFAIQIPFSLESFGFCDVGESFDYIADGRIEVGGEIPVNTHGGHLSDAYLHGQTHIIEAVKQLRGTANAQVNNAETALVTGGGNSALVLRKG
ncbi:MAG: lipid-transfer protein [Alphaproteobacteria bacterium]